MSEQLRPGRRRRARPPDRPPLRKEEEEEQVLTNLVQFSPPAGRRTTSTTMMMMKLRVFRPFVFLVVYTAAGFSFLLTAVQFRSDQNREEARRGDEISSSRQEEEYY